MIPNFIENIRKANSLEGDIATGLAIEILDKYRKNFIKYKVCFE